MEDYQISLVAQFFEPRPNVSPTSCHQFILDQIAPVLLLDAADGLDVQPSSFQGSMSYTVVLHAGSKQNQQRIVVQFRNDEQDLWGVTEANPIHGTVVPMVEFRGMYEGL